MFLELVKEREPCYIVVEVYQNCHLWVDMLNRKLGTAIAIPNELTDLAKDTFKQNVQKCQLVSFTRV